MTFSPNESTSIKPRVAGLFLMPLRWVCAWILFSAAWRRLILKPESLNPKSLLFEGMKLNHFLPDTLWTHASLNYLILHPWAMIVFLWLFTLLEATIGILLFIGLGTRFLGLILIFLFTNLMLTAGWLGSTCLDEWTVATFGITLGACLFLAGSGPFSLDSVIYKKYTHLIKHPFWHLFISPELSFIHDYKRGKILAILLSIITLGFVLYTNQHFVGGVYGPFKNPAVDMNIKAHADFNPKGPIDLTLYRDKGPDTYGAFIIDIALKNSQNQIIEHYTGDILGHLDPKFIQNFYLVKAVPNGHAILLPLGALATLQLPSSPVSVGNYSIMITDISGKTWQIPVTHQTNQPAFNAFVLTQH